MISVWKFPVPHPTPTNRSFIDTPHDPQFLSVGMQDDEMVVWALVDTEAKIAMRRLIVANTGDDIPLPPGSEFIGTVTSSNGIVWHVWDGDSNQERVGDASKRSADSPAKEHD